MKGAFQARSLCPPVKGHLAPVRPMGSIELSDLNSDIVSDKCSLKMHEQPWITCPTNIAVAIASAEHLALL
jgi:hypothetical protein